MHLLYTHLVFNSAKCQISEVIVMYVWRLEQTMKCVCVCVWGGGVSLFVNNAFPPPPPLLSKLNNTPQHKVAFNITELSLEELSLRQNCYIIEKLLLEQLCWESNFYYYSQSGSRIRNVVMEVATF